MRVTEIEGEKEEVSPLFLFDWVEPAEPMMVRELKRPWQGCFGPGGFHGIPGTPGPGVSALQSRPGFYANPCMADWLSVALWPLDPEVTFLPWKLVPLKLPRASTPVRDLRRRPSATVETQTSSVWPPLPSAPLPPPEELNEFAIGPPLSPLPLTPVKPRTPGRRKRRRINPRLSQQLFGTDSDTDGSEKAL
ncbi:hypothetical protein ALC60_00936 [Trachymyrmex zeteki]|uniref:Uncharacterized protein n=1 Tax=Mycetomoellerius zeteki TaxID=64791 RepID=A0A151XHY9_9HYME|nr:hypothetical protein ALC60_00936 [Trachymyrmex zeteki]